MQSPDGNGFEFIGLRLKRGTVLFYYCSFVAIAVLTAIGIATGDLGDALVGVPMLFILGGAISSDRRSVHVPPEMIVFVIAAFVLGTAGRAFGGEDGFVQDLAGILTGINLGILGLISVYIILKALPGIRDENRGVVAFIAVCIALASYAMIRMAQYWIQTAVGDGATFDLDLLVEEMSWILIGAVISATVYSIRRRANLFGGIINSFLEENSELIGMGDMQKADILKLIEEGESEWLEFKSTLRTNLQTGESDKRMEKAVLKTIVAFLNTDGGNLLIGVSDDGTIIGADVASFDNKDKMGLHLSNIISSQIGEEFIPYISFFMVDFGDKTVIRVKCDPCRDPVFLREGKTETFFIRKGPQSDDIAGTALLTYVGNRKRKVRKTGKNR